MRIIHFSDIHFGRPDYSLRSLFDKRLLGTVNFLLNRRGSVHEDLVARLLQTCQKLQPDLLVCSGDITCVGNPGEFAAAVEALDGVNQDGDPPLVYVPGNHDAYVKAGNCRRALDQARRTLNASIDDPCRPFVTTTVGQVALALVEQAHPTNIFLSTGTMTAENLRAVHSWTEAEAGTKVLVGHFPTCDAYGHPLGRRRHLNGADGLKRLLDQGAINVYLCGHIHTPFVRTTPAGSIESCAGSLTMKQTFTVIDIESSGQVHYDMQSI